MKRSLCHFNINILSVSESSSAPPTRGRHWGTFMWTFLLFWFFFSAGVCSCVCQKQRRQTASVRTSASCCCDGCGRKRSTEEPVTRESQTPPLPPSSDGPISWDGGVLLTLLHFTSSLQFQSRRRFSDFMNNWTQTSRDVNDPIIAVRLWVELRNYNWSNINMGHKPVCLSVSALHRTVSLTSGVTAHTRVWWSNLISVLQWSVISLTICNCWTISSL